MKIIMKNKVYIQKKDLVFMLKTHLEQQIPQCILNRCLDNNFKLIRDDDFLFWNEPEAISFFRQWIYCADYLELSRFTDDELYARATRILDQRNDLARVYNSLPSSQKNSTSPLVDLCDKLTFQMDSICEVLSYRQGLSGLKLPGVIGEQINAEKKSNNFFGGKMVG